MTFDSSCDCLLLLSGVQDVSVQLKQMYNCAPVFIDPDVRDKYYKGAAAAAAHTSSRVAFTAPRPRPQARISYSLAAELAPATGWGSGTSNVAPGMLLSRAGLVLCVCLVSCRVCALVSCRVL
jgi:hypothetical protein